MSSLNKNPKQYCLFEEQHDLIFHQEIKPTLFKKVKPSDNPVAIIFGGQPGAGKSKALTSALSQFVAENKPALIIGDELRIYHPEYEVLLVRDDKTAAFYTDQDTGRWIEKAITHAKALRCNVVIEGTMRVPEKVAETAISLRSNGYKVIASALAVNQRLSWQGVIERYEKQRAVWGYGRMTTPESHETSYNKMLETLEHIENKKLADQIILYRRGGIVIYENKLNNGHWESAPLARATVEVERERPWSLSEKRNYAQRFDQIVELLKNPRRRATQNEIKTIEALREEAHRQIPLTRKKPDIIRKEIEPPQAFLENPDTQVTDKNMKIQQVSLDNRVAINTIQPALSVDFFQKVTNPACAETEQNLQGQTKREEAIRVMVDKAETFTNGDRTDAMKKYPDLAPVYGTVAAAYKFAEQQFPDSKENQARFMAIARQVVAEKIAHGEPVPTPKIREANVQEYPKKQAKYQEQSISSQKQHDTDREKDR